MRVAIISDIHDNIWKLADALDRASEADVLICCGDLCSPFVIDRLGEGFAGPIHIVFGNNDADRFRITQKAGVYPQIHLHGEHFEAEFGGRSFAVNHFDNIARSLAAGQQFDVVCFGHNHSYEVCRIGQTLIINPGEIMGGLSAQQLSSLVIYDTETDEVEKIVLT